MFKHYHLFPKSVKRAVSSFLYPLLRSLKFKQLFAEVMTEYFDEMLIYAGEGGVDGHDNFGV